MTIERIIRSMAGFMVILALALAHFTGQVDLSQVSWLWLAAFVGLNLFQSGITGFCPPAALLKKLGLKDSGSCCQ